MREAPKPHFSADTDTILTSDLSVTASFKQHKFSHTCLDRTYKSRRVHAASLTYKVNIYSNDAAAADYLLSLIHETQPNLQRSNGHFEIISFTFSTSAFDSKQAAAAR